MRKLRSYFHLFSMLPTETAFSLLPIVAIIGIVVTWVLTGRSAAATFLRFSVFRKAEVEQPMVKIPSKLEDILPPAALGKILDVLNQPALSGAVRDALSRVGLKDASPVEQVQEAWQQARDWVGNLANRIVNPVHANPTLINATGELARIDWQGFPMSPSVAEACGVQSVNFHHAARLEEAAQHAAVKVLRAEDAMFTNGLASAIQLIVGGFKQCVISRADTVRIPGFGDLSGMLEFGGSKVHEVGATNGASAADWSRAVTANDQAILLVSPNSLTDADAAQQREAAIKVALATGAAVFEILIDGVCLPNDASASCAFPVAQVHLETGVSAIVLPTDGLLGGPAGACIAGKSKFIKSIRANATNQGLQLRGAALAGVIAAFERATLATPLDTGVVDLLRGNILNLKDRAKRMSIQLADSEHVIAAEVVERTNPLGPSPWNRYTIPSVALQLTARKDASQLMNVLQSGEFGPSILCALSGDKVLVDLKFVMPRDDHQIVKALNAMQPTGESDSKAGAAAPN